jgi:ferric-dicitrate binding protein FerR (iron transport regulator)
MPYKDAERKRQWERENREQRNAQRRKQRLGGQNHTSVAKRAPDPTSANKPQSVWPVLAQIVGFALMIGIGLLVGWVEVKAPTSGAVRGSN